MKEEGCRVVITAPSYEVAEAHLTRLTGAMISDTSLWREAGAYGRQVLAVLEAEETASNAPLVTEEAPATERVAEFAPLVGQQANVSLDGGMVLVRKLGWKEVKGVTISAVEPARQSAGAGARGPARPGPVAALPTKAVAKSLPGSSAAAATSAGASPAVRAPSGRPEPPVALLPGQKTPRPEPRVHLTRHSYRMRLAEADRFEGVQATEADRRRVQYASKLSAVHDGGPWCWRLSAATYPEAVEILDWPHGLEHLSNVAKAAFGEATPQAQTWYEAAEALLWAGAVEKVLDKWRELPRRRGERGKTIRKGRDYVQEHRARMRYQEFREQEYPIGSGSMESAVKNVVQWRMKRGGARWAEERVNPMLGMLGEFHSRRWDEMWQRVRLAKCA